LESAFKGRLGLAWLFSGVFLAIAFALRVVLFVTSLPLLEPSTWIVLKIFGIGLFFDIVTVTYFAAPYVLYLVLVPDRVFRNRVHGVVLQVVVLASLYLLLFVAVAEFYFFDEFGTRFNFIAVDYLVYTNEVLRDIHESYPLFPIIGAVLVVSLGMLIGVRRFMRASLVSPSKLSRRVVLATPWLVLPLLSWATVDGSWSRVSSNSYANEIASNGIYGFFAAFRQNQIDYAAFYPTLDDPTVSRKLRALVKEPNSSFVSEDPFDIRRDVRHGGGERQLNIVLVVVESLSAEYLGAFGGRGTLTPNLDRLAAESLIFTDLYATGTRTDRGLESLMLSVPPTPGRSIVKRPDNEDMFSLGSILKEKGYENKFIYGGYGYFDNMNYFFSHNGFAAVDRTDLKKDEITFENAWGVCDEDLFRRTIREIRDSHRRGKPFLVLALTTSNHRPYTYPAGRVDTPSGTGRAGAVQYTDYAIGKFMEDARREPWFQDTIFVIVADHCANSAGKVALPVHRYHIPLLVYSPEHIRPRRVDTMASQIDVGPTLLEILHLDYRTKFFGRDILAFAPEGGRALIGTYQKLGYMKNERLVVLDVKRKPAVYRCDPRTGEAEPVPAVAELIGEAIGLYQGADYLHKHRLDRRAGLDS
jgi:phosphoglycerol transferase MdoB-like AlkP superfamily enzyme